MEDFNMSKNILGLFDGSDIESITTLINTLEKSSFDYLKLEGDGLKIVIGKNGMSEVTEVSAPKAEAAPKAAAAMPEVKQAAEVTAQPVPAPEPAVKQAEAVSDQAGVVIIKSPSYGIFYAQSEPGAPAYVKLGDMVRQGDTMGLLEIMKTFNAITSDVTGEVVGIHVVNQQVLEPEQPLFSVKVK
jgi:acetyl-CoA carboxylase biotin carboxyl carrier protein